MAKAPRPVADATEQPHVEIPAGAVVDNATGEITDVPLSQRALATVGTPPKIKIKRQVTRPLLKHPDNAIVYVRFVSEPYFGKEIKSSQNTGIALMVNVNDVSHGAPGEFQYILNAVLYAYEDDKGKMLKPETNEEAEEAAKGIAAGKFTAKGELHDAFPDGLTGKLVAIRKFPKEGNKRYNTFEVVEIELAE